MDENIRYVINEFIKKINEYKNIADSKGVSYGYIEGSSVIINGISYPYSLAVEININQGDYVACVLTQDRYTAVVVGEMILEIVRGFIGAGIITDSGIKMPIGNMIFNVGDPVYTDGEYAFGHSPERGKFINFIDDAKELYFKIALVNSYTGQGAKISTFTIKDNKIIVLKNEELPIYQYLPRFYFSANEKKVEFSNTWYNPIEGAGSYGKINYYFNGNWYSLEQSPEVKELLSQVKTYPYSPEFMDLYGASNLPPYDEWPGQESDYYETQYMGDPCYALFLENKFIITMSISVNYIESRHVEEWYWKDRTPTEREIEKGYVRISYDDNGIPQYRYKAYDLVTSSGKKYKVDIVKLSIDIENGEAEVEHSLIPYEKYSNFISTYIATENYNEFRYSKDLIVSLTKDSDYADFYCKGKKELSLKIQIKYTGNNILDIAKYISNFIKVIRISEYKYIVGYGQSKLNLMYKDEIIDSYDLGQFTYLLTNLSEAFLK